MWRHTRAILRLIEYFQAERQPFRREPLPFQRRFRGQRLVFRGSDRDAARLESVQSKVHAFDARQSRGQKYEQALRVLLQKSIKISHLFIILCIFVAIIQ